VSDRLADSLEQILLARIRSGTIALPPLPAAAEQALRLLRKPEVSFRNVAAAIERDSALSVSVLRSGALGSRVDVRSVEHALVRSGMERARSVIFEAASKRLFNARDPALQKVLTGLWEHSLAVALVSRDLAAMVGVDSDLAYTAGLLHDVGKPIAASYLLEAERAAALSNGKFVGSDLFIAVVARTHRKLGVEVARKWDLHGVVRDAIEGGDDLVAADPVVRCVFLANALAKREGVMVGAVEASNEDVILVASALLGLDAGAAARVAENLRARPELQPG